MTEAPRINSTEFSSKEIQEIYQIAKAGIPTVSADEADITNETYIEARRASDAIGVASGTWTNLVDQEDADARNEFNSSQQFVPDQSGKYLIVGTAEFSITGGDAIAGRLRDVDAGSTVENRLFNTEEAVTNPMKPFAGVFNLTAGTKYEVQVVDFNSSFSVEASSHYEIVRQVVHP